jgi:hypothetical protein
MAITVGTALVCGLAALAVYSNLGFVRFIAASPVRGWWACTTTAFASSSGMR